MKIDGIDGVEYIQKSDCKATAAPKGDGSNPFMVLGGEFFIRTVTHYFTGRLIWVGEKELVMGEVAWIADTGRFNAFMAGKVANEIEPFPEGSNVIIGRGSIIDMVERPGGLPTTVK